MRINKNGLDEMQKERRNSIGNQMFILMYYTLLLDSGLYGVGIRWLKYPANTMVIITVFMGVYLIRTIAANAYLPPKAQNSKTVISLIMAIALVVAAVNLLGNLSARSTVEDANNNSALILFIISGVGLFISLMVAIIKRVSNKNDSDD